jgi:hypothetical protein
MFAKGEGGFKDRDLYPFCGGADGNFTAHPTLAGKSMKELKDKAGKPLARRCQGRGGRQDQRGHLHVAAARQQRSGPEGYLVTKVGDQVCAVGYYSSFRLDGAHGRWTPLPPPDSAWPLRATSSKPSTVRAGVRCLEAPVTRSPGSPGRQTRRRVRPGKDSGRGGSSPLHGPVTLIVPHRDPSARSPRPDRSHLRTGTNLPGKPWGPATVTRLASPLFLCLLEGLPTWRFLAGRVALGRSRPLSAGPNYGTRVSEE